MVLSLEAELSLGPGKHCSGEPGPLTGPVYPLVLLDKNKAPKAEAGFFEQTVDSSGAFEVLPFPANLRATVTYVGALEGAKFTVKYTFNDNTTVEVVQVGLSLLEHDPDNAVKGISVKGSGKIRWLAAGFIA